MRNHFPCRTALVAEPQPISRFLPLSRPCGIGHNNICAHDIAHCAGFRRCAHPGEGCTSRLGKVDRSRHIARRYVGNKRFAFRDINTKRFFQKQGFASIRCSQSVSFARHRRTGQIDKIRSRYRLLRCVCDLCDRCHPERCTARLWIGVPQGDRGKAGMQRHMFRHPAAHDPQANDRSFYAHLLIL